MATTQYRAVAIIYIKKKYFFVVQNNHHHNDSCYVGVVASYHLGERKTPLTKLPTHITIRYIKKPPRILQQRMV